MTFETFALDLNDILCNELTSKLDKTNLSHMVPHDKSLYLHQGMSLKQQQHKIKAIACQTEQQMR